MSFKVVGVFRKIVAYIFNTELKEFKAEFYRVIIN